MTQEKACWWIRLDGIMAKVTGRDWSTRKTHRLSMCRRCCCDAAGAVSLHASSGGHVWAMRRSCSPVRVRGGGINGFASRILPLWAAVLSLHSGTVRTDWKPLLAMIWMFRPSQRTARALSCRQGPVGAASLGSRATKVQRATLSVPQYMSIHTTRAANPGTQLPHPSSVISWLSMDDPDMLSYLQLDCTPGRAQSHRRHVGLGCPGVEVPQFPGRDCEQALSSHCCNKDRTEILRTRRCSEQSCRSKGANSISLWLGSATSTWSPTARES
jgi:hypothetical protein